jgi:predicted alpha/beta superfamily hydrolase
LSNRKAYKRTEKEYHGNREAEIIRDKREEKMEKKEKHAVEKVFHCTFRSKVHSSILCDSSY